MIKFISNYIQKKNNSTKNLLEIKKLRFIKSFDNIHIKDIFVSPTSSLKYSFKGIKSLPFKSAQAF